MLACPPSSSEKKTAVTGADDHTAGKIAQVDGIVSLLESRRLTEASALIKKLPDTEQAPHLCRLKEVRQDLDAVKFCRQVLKKQPGDSYIALSLARALHRDRRYSEASSLMDKQYEQSKSDVGFARAYIQYYERLRDLMKVESILEQQLQSGFDADWSRDRLGQVLMDKGRGELTAQDYSLAIRSFERLLEIQPDAHSFRYYLADAYAALGKSDAADKMRKEAKAAGVSPPPPLGASR